MLCIERPFGAGIQLQGVLDELYFYEGPLGANLEGGGVSIAVWAPTAQEVALM
jgi:hypothetical protein